MRRRLWRSLAPSSQLLSGKCSSALNEPESEERTQVKMKESEERTALKLKEVDLNFKEVDLKMDQLSNKIDKLENLYILVPVVTTVGAAFVAGISNYLASKSLGDAIASFVGEKETIKKELAASRSGA